MKTLKILASALTSIVAFASCSARPATEAQNNQTDMKSAIVYFTHSGNTELAAKELAKVTGAPLIRLYPQQAYSTADVDWENEQSRCTREHLDQSLRPAIKPVDVNFAELDTLYLGFPIWWHEEPAVIRTFLDQYGPQLKNVQIYPFCTSYESPMSEADTTQQKGYPGLHWHTGLRLPAPAATIRSWISGK